MGVIASLVLGAVFLVAGASKLSAGARWSGEARGIGVPRAAMPAVPWVELVLGSMLVVRVAPVAVASVAAVLLVVYTAALVGAMVVSRGGRPRPTCACFGSWSARPVGWPHLVRNGALFAVALAIVAAG